MANSKMKKEKATKKKTVLYLHVSKETKAWLKNLCAKQAGHVSQSTMAEQLFRASRKLGLLDRKAS
jgi:hypothetical protein